MTIEKIISGLQMTMDLIQFDPVTGLVRPIYTLNDIDKTTYVACKAAIEALKAQDITGTNVGDTISRQAAKLSVARVTWEDGDSCYDFHDKCVDCLDDVPPAQPDLDEWCTDCKEYDQERHCCPRWNRVIRQTLKDAQPEIIHCGECKHRDPEDHKCDCGHDILWQLPRDDEWYCADAERKNNV